MPEITRKLLYAACSKGWTHLIKHKDNFPSCYFIYLENTTTVNVAVSLNMNEIHTQTHIIVTMVLHGYTHIYVYHYNFKELELELEFGALLPNPPFYNQQANKCKYVSDFTLGSFS